MKRARLVICQLLVSLCMCALLIMLCFSGLPWELGKYLREVETPILGLLSHDFTPRLVDTLLFWLLFGGYSLWCVIQWTQKETFKNYMNYVLLFLFIFFWFFAYANDIMGWLMALRYDNNLVRIKDRWDPELAHAVYLKDELNTWEKIYILPMAIMLTWGWNSFARICFSLFWTPPTFILTIVAYGLLKVALRWLKWTWWKFIQCCLWIDRKYGPIFD